jgi:hypothetical protein
MCYIDIFDPCIIVCLSFVVVLNRTFGMQCLGFIGFIFEVAVSTILKFTPIIAPDGKPTLKHEERFPIGKFTGCTM